MKVQQFRQSLCTAFVSIALITGSLAPAALAAGHHRGRHFRKPAARVDTPWERKADRNHDGYVGPREADKAKKDFIRQRAVVDSKWEHHADRNHDGYVGPREAARARR